MTKVVEVRGFSFTGSAINLHVRKTNLPLAWNCFKFLRLASKIVNIFPQRFSATCKSGTYDVLASHCRASLGYTVRLRTHHSVCNPWFTLCNGHTYIAQCPCKTLNTNFNQSESSNCRMWKQTRSTAWSTIVNRATYWTLPLALAGAQEISQTWALSKIWRVWVLLCRE